MQPGSLPGDWDLVPDLAVEVVSPNDLFTDVIPKMHEYFRVGVRQVWIVLPIEEEVYVYDSPTSVRILTAADELQSESLLPGFRLLLADLFKVETARRCPQVASRVRASFADA